MPYDLFITEHTKCPSKKTLYLQMPNLFDTTFSNLTTAAKTISNIGLGCVTFGREIDEQSSFSMLDHAFSKGITLFDTAAAYGNGASETILGKWQSQDFIARDSIVIATKILPPFDAENIKRSVDESMKRLKTETIDLLYLHRWDTTLDDDSLQALDNLINEGEVQALGASNFTAEQLSATLKKQSSNNLATFQFVQNNHNLAVSDITPGFKSVCEQYNVNIVTYSPLGAGFLTGKHQQGVEAGTRFDLIPAHQNIYFNESAYARLAKLQQVADRTGYTTSHLALAWALHQQGIASVLIGGRTIEHINQALEALTFNDLSILEELGALQV